MVRFRRGRRCELYGMGCGYEVFRSATSFLVRFMPRSRNVLRTLRGGLMDAKKLAVIGAVEFGSGRTSGATQFFRSWLYAPDMVSV
jgi:hypothetical protein